MWVCVEQRIELVIAEDGRPQGRQARPTHYMHFLSLLHIPRPAPTQSPQTHSCQPCASACSMPLRLSAASTSAARLQPFAPLALSAGESPGPSLWWWVWLRCSSCCWRACCGQARSREGRCEGGSKVVLKMGAPHTHIHLLGVLPYPPIPTTPGLLLNRAAVPITPCAHLGGCALVGGGGGRE